MMTDTHIPKLGIDCNGLAYYVINEATDGVVMEALGDYSYSHGVTIDGYLCSTKYGTQKTKAKDIVPGCFLHLNDHIIIVYDVIKTNGVVTQIKYAHSQLIRKNCSISGPNKGRIIINDENKDLNAQYVDEQYIQEWIDEVVSGEILQGMYIKTMLLNCVAPFTS